MENKVVITGVGLVSSLGNDLDTTWKNLLEGKSGISRIDDFNAEGFKCPYGAIVHGLDPDELKVHVRDSRIMDRHAYMLLKSSRDAFQSSSVDLALTPPERVSYFAAMGMIDYHAADFEEAVIQAMDNDGKLNYDKFFSASYENIFPLWPLSMLNNIHFCQVAIDLGIKGESIVFCPHARHKILVKLVRDPVEHDRKGNPPQLPLPVTVLRALQGSHEKKSEYAEYHQMKQLVLPREQHRRIN